MTLQELKAVRDGQDMGPFLLVLTDGRKLAMESPRYLGITSKGVVLAVSMSGTYFLAPEQIKEVMGTRAKAG
jgi:hypothetical protein